jgi:hypothetical protein
MQSGHAQKRAWNKDKNTADAQKWSGGAGFYARYRTFPSSCDNCATAERRLRKIRSGKDFEFGKDFRPQMRAKNARLCAELGDLVDEPRHLATGGVAMNGAHLAGADYRRLRFRHGGNCSGAIAGGDRFLDFTHGGAQARAPRLIDHGTARDLARGLLGGFGIGHADRAGGFPRMDENKAAALRAPGRFMRGL